VARRVYRFQIARQSAPSVDLSQTTTEHQTTSDKIAPADAALNQDSNPFAAALAKNSERPVIKNQGIKSKKIGRNDPCPCGSGKKWKKCHYPQIPS